MSSPVRRAVLAAVLIVPPILSLRWPFPLAWATLRGEGVIDGTIAAFILPVFLIVLSLPGFIASRMMNSGRTVPSSVYVQVIRISLLAMLISSLLIMLWIIVTFVRMRVTLPSPAWSLTSALLMPLTTMIIAVQSRLRFERQTKQYLPGLTNQAPTTNNDGGKQ